MGMVFGKTGVAEPAFQVLLSRTTNVTTSYEIREYGKRFAIETVMGTPASSEGEGATATKPVKDKQKSSFYRLAGYIGVMGPAQNKGSTAIAMTAPVVMTSAETKTEEDSPAETKTEDDSPAETKTEEEPPAETKTEEESSTPDKTESSDKSPPPPEGTKIAMTAPVIMTGASKTEEAAPSMSKMLFILPADYDDISKIPEPTDPSVTIKELPPAVGAVHRYNGAFNDTANAKKMVLLASQLAADGLTGFMTEEEGKSDPTAEAWEKSQFWGYNPPFTLPFRRRNEVWMELTAEQVEALKAKFGEEAKKEEAEEKKVKEAKEEVKEEEAEETKETEKTEEAKEMAEETTEEAKEETVAKE